MSEFKGLIGVDLDGTVLDDSKKVSGKVSDTISRAINMGYMVIPVTGRPMIGLPEDLMSIPGMKYAVTANGAEIYKINSYTNRDYEKISYNNLSPDAIYQTLLIAEDFDAVCDVFIDGVGHIDLKNKARIPDLGFSPAVTEYILATKSYDQNFMEVIKQNINNIAKITVNFSMKNNGLEVKAQCKKVLETIDNVNVVSGAVQNLEVTDIKACKGDGLLLMAGILGIGPDCTMAIGDDGNDMDMVKKAHIGVAMGNAVTELKDAADFITEDNKNDGVAWAIERFISGEYRV